MRYLSTQRQLVLCWLFQTLLVISRWDISRAQSLFSRECARNEDCGDGSTCTADHCIPTDCVARELKAFGLALDPRAYKAMIFREADLTEEDLQLAKKEAKDDAAFSQSPQVQALMGAIQKHSLELSLIGDIIRSCDQEGGESITGIDNQDKPETDTQDKPETGENNRGIGVGTFVGDLFNTAVNRFWVRSNSPSVSSIPSLAPSESPSSGPSGKPSSSPSMSQVPSSTPTKSSAPSRSLAPSLTPTGLPSAAPTNRPSTSPSAGPTRSVAPSSHPSANPTIAVVQQRTYSGIHMEGGIFFDYGFSLFSESSNNTGSNARGYTFKRGCFGAEVGLGFEVSILVIVTSNQYATDIVGGSIQLEQDVALGGALGVAVGGAVTGDAFGSECPFYIEVTLGGGLGFGLGGALCRTGFVID